MTEFIKFQSRPNDLFDYENASISQKMEAIGKLIAFECCNAQKDIGGNTYTFKIEDVSLKHDNLGTVTIQWEKQRK